MMLRFLLTIFIILLNVGQLLCQTTQPEIDQKVKTLKNNLNNFQKIEKIKGSTGYKNIFVNTKSIQKIEVCSIENNIEKKVEWFYDNTVLIYTEKNWKDLSTNTVIDTEKLYTNKDELISWIKNGHFVDHNNSDYQEVSTRIIAYGKSAFLHPGE